MIPKPGVSPAVLKLALYISGVLCFVALAVVPKDYWPEVIGAGSFLIGWAKRSPGDVSLTTNVDDL